MTANIEIIYLLRPRRRLHGAASKFRPLLLLRKLRGWRDEAWERGMSPEPKQRAELPTLDVEALAWCIIRLDIFDRNRNSSDLAAAIAAEYDRVLAALTPSEKAGL